MTDLRNNTAVHLDGIVHARASLPGGGCANLGLVWAGMGMVPSSGRMGLEKLLTLVVGGSTMTLATLQMIRSSFV